MDAFVEETGYDIEFERVHRPLPDIHDSLVRGDGLDSYDLFLCLSDWLPAVADAGMLVPLDEYVDVNPPPDWSTGWADSMRDLVEWNGSIYAIPYHDGPEVFHYREDLFENVANQRRFNTVHIYSRRVLNAWQYDGSCFFLFARHFGRIQEIPRSHSDVGEPPRCSVSLGSGGIKTGMRILPPIERRKGLGTAVAAV